MTPDEKRRVARLHMRARRRRAGELRRKSIFLSLALFGLLWAAVFAQMVSGHDPVLGNGTKVAAASHRTTQHHATRSKPSGGAGEELAIDPETGTVVEVPSGSSSTSGASQSTPAPQPAAPAPVTTSQS
jgi:hypothetical protein